jgi:hypothetical protein
VFVLCFVWCRQRTCDRPTIRTSSHIKNQISGNPASRGLYCPEAPQTAEDGRRILTANAIAYLYLQEYIMDHVRKEMVLKYRSGKSELFVFVPMRFLPVNNHIGKLYLEKLVVAKPKKTFIAFNGIRRCIITDM